MTFLAFDIDGTIYDCGDIIVEAFQRGVDEFREMIPSRPVEIPAREVIVSVIGTPTDQIFKRLFPGLREAEHRMMNDLCTRNLSKMVREGGGAVFEGVNDTLERLHKEGSQLLVASNGREEYIDAVLETHDLKKYFRQPYVLINDVIRDKTDIVRYYRNSMSCDALLIMIGDRTSDRDAASLNGIPFIGCAFGHAGQEEITGSRWIVHRFRDILPRIKEIEREAEK